MSAGLANGCRFCENFCWCIEIADNACEFVKGLFGDMKSLLVRLFVNN